MAEADIAYVATAGAAGLALALSAWGARLRGRLAARARAAEAELSVAQAALADRDGALAAFEDARLALTPDGHTCRLGSPAAWSAITRELGGREEDGADPALVVLDAIRAVAGPRLDGLIDQGEAFDAVLDGVGGAWAVEGRSSAGAAWLRLSRLGLVGTAAESGLGLLADAYPAPTWITDAAGRLAWANKAWLAEMKAENIDAARENLRPRRRRHRRRGRPAAPAPGGVPLDHRRRTAAGVADRGRAGPRRGRGGAGLRPRHDRGRGDARHPAPPRRGP